MRLGLKQTRVTDMDSARALPDRPEGPGCTKGRDVVGLNLSELQRRGGESGNARHGSCAPAGLPGGFA